MTGKEALIYLQAGFTLRRESWEPDEKCKAYFSDNLWSIPVSYTHLTLPTICSV